MADLVDCSKAFEMVNFDSVHVQQRKHGKVNMQEEFSFNEKRLGAKRVKVGEADLSSFTGVQVSESFRSPQVRPSSTRQKKEDRKSTGVQIEESEAELRCPDSPSETYPEDDSDVTNDTMDGRDSNILDDETQTEILNQISELMDKAFKLEGMHIGGPFNKVKVEEKEEDEDDVEAEECSYVHFPEDYDFKKEYSQCPKEKLTSTESKLNEPLFQGAFLTLGVTVLLLAALSMHHKLSAEALGDFITFINFLLPPDSIFPRTLYLFKKFFHDWRPSLKIHYYCNYCLIYLEKDHKNCPNTFCNKDLCVSSAKAFFIEIPIVEQLKTLFARPGFYSDLNYHFKR